MNDSNGTREIQAASAGPGTGVRRLAGLGLGFGYDDMLDGRPPSLGVEHDDFSPYPPIADYGFLSDCEVTALVAPSGAIEWMSMPRMDCPSVFGALLDRDAGWFRFGPEDMMVSADRRYLPGTMVLETSWDCGEGWLVVRDCLVMGRWRHEHRDRSTHRRPPTDYDAEHMLLRTVRCVNGSVQLSMDCEPAFDYGRHRGRWEYTGQGYKQAVITDGGDLTHPHFRHPDRPGGPERARPDPAEGGRDPVLRPVVGQPQAADRVRGRAGPASLDGPPLAALAGSRLVPRPPLAQLPHAQCADAQGPHVRAHRRDRCRCHNVAARDPARRAELGLPLQLDQGRHVRAVGPVHAGL